MRLLIKLFPVCRIRVNCWSLALLMAFCFGFLLTMIEMASEGAEQGILWLMSLSSAGDVVWANSADDNEAIVYMEGLKGMTWLLFCGCSSWLFIGLDK